VPVPVRGVAMAMGVIVGPAVVVNACAVPIGTRGVPVMVVIVVVVGMSHAALEPPRISSEAFSSDTGTAPVQVGRWG
jgi:hypothetical protein